MSGTYHRFTMLNGLMNYEFMTYETISMQFTFKNNNYLKKNYSGLD